MFTAVQDSSGRVVKSEGGKLDDMAISNMISILTNPELSKLFTDDELLMIKMAVKTNIAGKASSVLRWFKDKSEGDSVMLNDERGKKLF